MIYCRLADATAIRTWKLFALLSQSGLCLGIITPSCFTLVRVLVFVGIVRQRVKSKSMAQVNGSKGTGQ
jgi:hypothetical protein